MSLNIFTKLALVALRNLAAFYPFKSQGQSTGKFSGRIIDSASRQPLAFTTIQILDTEKSR